MQLCRQVLLLERGINNFFTLRVIRSCEKSARLVPHTFFFNDDLFLIAKLLKMLVGFFFLDGPLLNDRFFLLFLVNPFFNLCIEKSFCYAVAQVSILPFFLHDALVAYVWLRFRDVESLWQLPDHLVFRAKLQSIGWVSLVSMCFLPFVTLSRQKRRA